MSAATWTTTWHKRKGLDPAKVLPHTQYYGGGMDSISDYAARTTMDRWGGQTSWTRAERPSNKDHQRNVARNWKKHQDRMDREIQAVQEARWIELNIMQAELNEAARLNASLKKKPFLKLEEAPSTLGQKKPKKGKKKNKKNKKKKAKANEEESVREGFLPSIGGPRQQQQQQPRRRNAPRRPKADEDSSKADDELSVVERDKQKAKDAIMLNMIPHHLHRDFSEEDLDMLQHVLSIPSPRNDAPPTDETAPFDVTAEIRYVGP